MKKTLLTIILAVALVSWADAQSPSTAYWVVETNVTQRDYSIVRFYDTENRLIHEVRIEGVYIEVSNPIHKKYLNRVLKDLRQRKSIVGRVMTKGNQNIKSSTAYEAMI